jgi:hypothetical protein
VRDDTSEEAVTVQLWNKGLGATASVYGTQAPMIHTGNTWFVDSATGTDDVSPRGLNEMAPLATLAQAIANAADGDFIVLADTHDEDIDDVALDIKVFIMGSGESGGVPMAKLRANYTGSSHAGLYVTSGASGSVISNVDFINEAAGRALTLYFAERVKLDSCVFHVDFPLSRGLYAVSADGLIMDRCTFIAGSTGADVEGFVLQSVDDAELRSVVMDAGAIGWKLGVGGSIGTHSLDARVLDINLVRGSDIVLDTAGASASTGFCSTSDSSTGKPRVGW